MKVNKQIQSLEKEIIEMGRHFENKYANLKKELIQYTKQLVYLSNFDINCLYSEKIKKDLLNFAIPEVTVYFNYNTLTIKDILENPTKYAMDKIDKTYNLVIEAVELDKQVKENKNPDNTSTETTIDKTMESITNMISKILGEQ